MKSTLFDRLPVCEYCLRLRMTKLLEQIFYELVQTFLN